MKKAKPPVMNDRQAMEYAVASTRMEGFEFTPEELADFEKIAKGEMTTEQYRAKIKAEIKKLRQEKPECFMQEE